MKKYPFNLAGSIRKLEDSIHDETVSDSLKCAIIIVLHYPSEPVEISVHKEIAVNQLERGGTKP